MRYILWLLLTLVPDLLASPFVQSVAPGIYVHVGAHRDLDQNYGGDIANIGFIVGTKCVAVIDTGGSRQIGDQLRAAVRSVTSLPICYVINTHVHPDHLMGNAAFVPDKPEFIGHGNLASTMRLRQSAYLKSQQSWVPSDTGNTMIFPTRAVQEQMTLELGGRTIRLQAHGIAHTHTDLTVLDEQTSTLWSGDLLFSERTPSLEGDAVAWITLLQDFKRQAVRQIIPGHGQVTNAPGVVIDRQIGYLTVLLNDIRTAIRSGKSMADTMHSAAISEQANWVLFDLVNPRNVNFLYPQLEWE